MYGTPVEITPLGDLLMGGGLDSLSASPVSKPVPEAAPSSDTPMMPH